VILDRVVQQRRADHVGVGDPVVGHDPDGHPEQVVDVWFALAPVARVQPGGEIQRLADPGPVGGGQARGLDGEALAQSGLAVQGGDRVQRHGCQQPPFAGIHGVHLPAPALPPVAGHVPSA
jgi:hypothetical protein